MTKRKLMIAGGGGADDSMPLDEKFASWVGPTGKMLYLPIAMDGQNHSYEMALAWVQRTFAPFEMGAIEMWTELTAARKGALDQFKAIYIGGGNTFRLLHLIRAGGFETALCDFVERGGAVYGGSAGAILLGRDILTCAHLDTNDVGLQDATGLDLIDGYAVWCHYQPEDEARISRYVEKQRIAILALSERSGICLENDQLLAVGYDGVRKFDGRGQQYIEIGQVID